MKKIRDNTIKLNQYLKLMGIVPSGEVWAFQPGECVRCVEHTFANGEMGLVVSMKI